MDFPHLQNATKFPDTDTRVYEQYRNVFDYNVWTPNTVIKLCRVNWYNDYHDVVKFPDDAARDAWFDKLDGETVKLTTNMYIARADTDGIKLPIPYMTAQRYNYIVVDFRMILSIRRIRKPTCRHAIIFRHLGTRRSAEHDNMHACT